MKILPLCDPLKTLDDMIRQFKRRPYPNDESVLGDTLRGPLSKLYKINMNVFETHCYKIDISPTNISTPQIWMYHDCYIYEGLSEDREVFRYEYNGKYPEGILLGFLSTDIRSLDYNSDTDTFINVFIDLAMIGLAFINHVYDLRDSDKGAYADYLRAVCWMFPLYYLIRHHDLDLSDEKIVGPFKYLIDVRRDHKNSEDKFVEKVIKVISEDPAAFVKICRSFDYITIYRWLVDNGIV